MKTLYPSSSSMHVSAKFYSRLCERVHSIVPALKLHDSDHRENDVLLLINNYLQSSALDPEGENRRPELDDLLKVCSDTICVTIFLTLKAEIDTAIDRSRRARARAADRRARQLAADGEPVAANIPESIDQTASVSATSDHIDSTATAVSAAEARVAPSVPRKRYGIRLRQVHTLTRHSRSGKRRKRA